MKRGAISIETLIIIILAILTLVIVAAAFTGGMKSLWEKITGISSLIPQADKDAAIALCKGYCDNVPPLTEAFCGQKFEGTLKGLTCKGLYPSCAITCPTA